MVLLGHSLGGLIIKQALVNLSNHSRDQPAARETLDSVCSMLFFGVPCHGLDGERLGLAAMAKGQPTEGFMSDMRHGSPMTERLAHEFLNVFNNRPWVSIYSFYETIESVTAVVVSFLELLAMQPTDFPAAHGQSFDDRAAGVLGGKR
jgi:hypothetical protein